MMLRIARLVLVPWALIAMTAVSAHAELCTPEELERRVETRLRSFEGCVEDATDVGIGKSFIIGAATAAAVIVAIKSGGKGAGLLKAIFSSSPTWMGSGAEAVSLYQHWKAVKSCQRRFCEQAEAAVEACGYPHIDLLLGEDHMCTDYVLNQPAPVPPPSTSEFAPDPEPSSSEPVSEFEEPAIDCAIGDEPVIDEDTGDAICEPAALPIDCQDGSEAFVDEYGQPACDEW